MLHQVITVNIKAFSYIIHFLFCTVQLIERACLITLCAALGPRLQVVFIFLSDSRENETGERAWLSPAARKVPRLRFAHSCPWENNRPPIDYFRPQRFGAIPFKFPTCVTCLSCFAGMVLWLLGMKVKYLKLQTWWPCSLIRWAACKHI